QGTVAFTDPGSHARINFADSTNTIGQIGQTGQILASTSGSLAIGGTFTTLSNNGNIQGNQIVIRGGRDTLNIKLSNSGQISAYPDNLGHLILVAKSVNLTGGLIQDTVLSIDPPGEPAAVTINTQFQGNAALGDVQATSLSVTSVKSGISIAPGAFISANSIAFNSAQTIAVNADATLLSFGIVSMKSTGDFSI